MRKRAHDGILNQVERHNLPQIQLLLRGRLCEHATSVNFHEARVEREAQLTWQAVLSTLWCQCGRGDSDGKLAHLCRVRAAPTMCVMALPGLSRVFLVGVDTGGCSATHLSMSSTASLKPSDMAMSRGVMPWTGRARW